MVESLERRAMFLTAVAALVLALNSGIGFVYGAETWHVAVYVAGVAALVITVGLSVLALAPDHPRTAALPERPMLLFWAHCALAAAVLFIGVNAASSAVQAIGGRSPFE
jgi:hypothetical protein